MSLASTGFWADLAAIFGAISIFITLIFIIIELRKNFEQFRIIREIHLHDVQNQYYLFWSRPNNANLYLRPQKILTTLVQQKSLALRIMSNSGFVFFHLVLI